MPALPLHDHFEFFEDAVHHAKNEALSAVKEAESEDV
jgi:DNA-binding protein YbaB